MNGRVQGDGKSLKIPSLAGRMKRPEREYEERGNVFVGYLMVTQYALFPIKKI